MNVLIRPVRLLSFLLFATLFTSCGGDPSDPNSNPGDRLQGVLSGDVFLADEYGRSLTDHSGVTISVEGTSYSTTTNSAGYWKFDALPAGIYTIRYTKDGFAEWRNTGFQFVGGGQFHLEAPPLYRYPTYTISDFRMYVTDTAHKQYTLRIGDTIRTDTGKVVLRVRDTVVTRVETGEKRIVIKGTLNQTIPQGLTGAIAIVIGTDPSVSKEPGRFKTIILADGNASQFYRSEGLGSFIAHNSLSAGEHIYAVAYPAVPYEYYIYGDPERRTKIPAFVGGTSSNVQDAVLQ